MFSSSRETLETKRNFKNTNLFYILPELELQYPAISSELLDSYIRGLRARWIIPEPNKMSYG